MKPRVLIVGTVPYNKKMTSRAFESYFCNWEKVNLAQIFSNTKRPTKGHCATFFQITDQRLIKKRFKRRLDTGVVYRDQDLSFEWTDNSLEVNSSLYAKLYKLGGKKNSIIYMLRKFIWVKKYWCTDKLNTWLDDFNPECVFLSFSDDFFILEIALYVAERFNIPIVSTVGDDYYFNHKITISPLYNIYKILYKRLVREVFKRKGGTIYISDKIRDQYNRHFSIDGKTVYLASSIKCREFKEINIISPKIVYCGNIRLGRNTSLNDIGISLGEINTKYILDVYSNETDNKYYKLFDQNKNIRFHGSIPYSKVQEVMQNSDIVVVVEGFKKDEINISRYSLSTKVADSIATGANVLAYGSIDCGAIDYLKKVDCGIVCTNSDELMPSLNKLIGNVKLQKEYYLNTRKILEQNHNIVNNSKIFEDEVISVIKDGI